MSTSVVQLNLLHIMALYRRLLENPDPDVPSASLSLVPGRPVTTAKTIIYAINQLAVQSTMMSHQGQAQGVFLPNYWSVRVERIIPAADVSSRSPRRALRRPVPASRKPGLTVP